MNFNDLIFNSNISNAKNEEQNFTAPLYPNYNCEIEKKDINTSQNNNFDFSNLLKILSVFNSKKPDLKALLASPIGKSLGLNENLINLLSILQKNKQKPKIESLQVENENLPKIDSLERLS